jgi:hypothetical protein
VEHGPSVAKLELSHRPRARAEDRIRATRATDLRNLPLHGTAQDHIWPEIVQIALDLLAWMPMLVLTGTATSMPSQTVYRAASAAWTTTISKSSGMTTRSLKEPWATQRRRVSSNAYLRAATPRIACVSPKN